jgi:uncharacterized protein YfaS (alpha-2-macroglobulin family)
MLRLCDAKRVLLAALVVGAWIGAAHAASVDSFAPTGTVKDVRQATARFSTDMVALGDPRLPDPFDVRCAAEGKGRWVDTRHWVYDFAAPLPGGLSCSFTLKDGLRTPAGAAVTGPRRFEFDTGGPAVRGALPHEGSQQIDERQLFVLALDAPADPASIEANAYCAVEGIGERVPVEVLRGERRAAALKQQRATRYPYYNLLWPESWGEIPPGASLEREEERLALLRCRRALPPATRVELVWDAGIAAPSGLASATPRVLSYRVRPAFSASVECERVNANAGCLPMRPVRLRFSAPVPRDKALAIALAAPGGRTFGPTADQGATVEGVTFRGPFPERSTLEVTLPPGLVDDAGRRLENAQRFPLDLRIDAFPPLAKFAATFGIVEAREGGVLPVTLRAVEPLVSGQAAVTPPLSGNALRLSADDKAIADWLRRVQRGMEQRGDWVRGADGQRWEERTGDTSVFGDGARTMSFRLPKPEGARAFEVVGIPLKNPGFYVVELASPILGEALMAKGKVRHVATAALVTDMAVHFKWGREGSGVWVTGLRDGRPVAGAGIAVSDFCTGQPLWSGETGRKGIAAIPPGKLPEPGYGSERCDEWSPHPLMVSARTADDMSFTLTSWNRGIAPYDFNLGAYGDTDPTMVHTVFDRPLFRAGETVSMKHFLRRHASAGIRAARPAAPVAVAIVHRGSEQRYESTLAFDANGIAEQTWRIPEEARLGDYGVEIRLADDRVYRAGSFKVEQFRVPTMSAVVQVPDAPLVRPREVPLDLHLRYLSGGGAGNAPAKLRTVVAPFPPSFPEHEGFAFGGKPVKEGLQPDERGDGAPAGGRPVVQVMPLTLDAQGALRVMAPVPGGLAEPSRMVAELEYADANGEVQTATGRVALWPAAINVGVKVDGWAGSRDSLRFSVVVLDLKGRPVAGQEVRVALYQRTTYAYRKRLIGGFYDYESTTRVSRLPVSCDGDTDRHGLLRCDVAPGVGGEIIIRAQARDRAGHAAGATQSAWVVGEDDTWFDQSASDRMDVLPEAPEYQAGQTARLQVRSPFRRATALVTIEREGVIDSFVTEISGRDPVIEVPIRDNYAPNVFVSVLAVRGRVGDWRGWLADMAREYDLPRWLVNRDGGRPTALVDLGKPAYKLGVARIRVGWQPHRLDVTVKPSGDTFRVREQAKVRVHVERPGGRALPAGGEVAIAAVDEGLLALAPNRSWNLLEAMMDERALEVWSSTAQMQVVGKRHYGRKAVPAGGGGGREGARELFDTLLLWKGRVKLDANGDAEVTIPLNDSLTSFRIVAVASAGEGLFGTGSASIATTQELMLHSGLPPLVRDGDRFDAVFTVRNTTGRALTVEAVAAVAPAPASPLPKRTVEVPAGGARDVSWPVTVPADAGRLAWNVGVRAKGAALGDELRVAQAVEAAVPVRVQAATLAQVEGTLALPVARPADALPGRGGVAVTLRPRLGAGLDGVREYMAAYPYSCFEQLASRAVALRDPAQWRGLMARLPAYRDPDGLLKYFDTDLLQGDDTLTAYLLAIAHEAGWEIPEADRAALLQGLAAFVEGRIARSSALPTADLAIRKIAAVEALSRYDAANAAMLTTIPLDPAGWPTSAVIDWRAILTRLADVPDRERRLAQADSILRARIDLQGTVMSFSTERADALWWLMVSPDVNAARAILGVLGSPRWRADMPRMVRGALGRQRAGHWDTTVANAWGVLAMEKFSAAFEAAPVTGTTELAYGPLRETVAWDAGAAEHRRELPWADGAPALRLTQQGTGRPWAMVRTRAAVPLRQPLSSGFSVTRTVTPVERATPGVWTRGDVARVRLEIEARADMTWVVVDDPIPAGATILGGGLGRSETLAAGEGAQGAAFPAFEERRFDGFVAYYRFVPRGRFAVEYTVRFNNPGTFQLPATRVEAMYAPEMMGEVPNAPVAVRAP